MTSCGAVIVYLCAAGRSEVRCEREAGHDGVHAHYWELGGMAWGTPADFGPSGEDA